MTLEDRRLRRAFARTAAVTLAVAVAAVGGKAESPAAGPASTLIAQPELGEQEVLRRFLARPEAATRSFRAHRRLEVTCDALRKKAWLDALVELDAERDFRFTVTASGGSGTLQQKILEKVLRAEQEVRASEASGQTSLSADNYVFAPCGQTADGLVCIAVSARRKELGLLNGRLLVSPDTADVVLVSGTMARGPSFWVPRVELSKQYARIQGHWVNVYVESVSHVRLLGEARFTMTTVYDQIEGDLVFPVLASTLPDSR